MALHTQLPIYKVAYGLFDVIMDLAKNMPRDFPAQFEALASVQELIGPIAYLFRNRKTGERYSLRALPPNKGRYQDDPDVEGHRLETAGGRHGSGGPTGSASDRRET